jgi:membrane fusion protein, copper/silver efflux system
MMKTKMLIYASLLLMFFSACDNGSQKATKESEKTSDIYTCSMHPQIIEHHPGKCPICGMQLVKKNATLHAAGNIQPGVLLKPTNEFVVAALPVITPTLKSINVPVKAFGTIEYDTRAAATISARVSGRIEKLYIRYRFQEIQKGQKIMDIYSPEILTAEQNLLFLLQNDGANTSFIIAAKAKLLLLGMSDGQLNEVIKNGKPLYAVSVYSNYSGHVHDAGMTQGDMPAGGTASNVEVTEELSLKEGMYIQKGQTILMIMDHHMVWAALQIFSSDQGLIKTGNRVDIIPETDTAALINGHIDFIEPFLRSNSKTLTARVYFHNENMLPIGAHVTASIYTNNQRALWLPQSAIITLGMGEAAFIKTSAGFIAHKIVAGLHSANEVQIIFGLSEKDSVALNAQYLIDSESFIKTSSK